MAIYVEQRLFGLLTLIFLIILLWLYMDRAGKGKIESIRRLPIINAIDEAIGRATEMGRPVLLSYSHKDDLRPATMVGLEAVSYLAKLTAEKGAKLIVPMGGARTYPIAVENYRTGCLQAGMPEVFKETNIMFYGNNQFAYTDGVMGTIQREKPGSGVFLGPFWLEIMHIGLQAKRTDTFTVGGIDSYSMGAFAFIVLDYTILGSELYATGAYMSEDPMVINTITSEDIVKWLIALITFAGAIVYSFGSDIIVKILTM